MDWRNRTLRAGALFCVGDPKQAIYRFRGADVDTYVEAREAIGSNFQRTFSKSPRTSGLSGQSWIGSISDSPWPYQQTGNQGFSI